MTKTDHRLRVYAKHLTAVLGGHLADTDALGNWKGCHDVAPDNLIVTPAP